MQAAWERKSFEIWKTKMDSVYRPKLEMHLLCSHFKMQVIPRKSEIHCGAGNRLFTATIFTVEQ